MAADPIVQYMSRKQLERVMKRTSLYEGCQADFIEAAQYQDEVLKMEELLKKKKTSQVSPLSQTILPSFCYSMK